MVFLVYIAIYERVAHGVYEYTILLCHNSGGTISPELILGMGVVEG